MSESASRSQFYDGPERRKEPQLATIQHLDELRNEMTQEIRKSEQQTLATIRDMLASNISNMLDAKTQMVQTGNECRENMRIHVESQRMFNKSILHNMGLISDNIETLTTMVRALQPKQSKSKIFDYIPAKAWVWIGIGVAAVAAVILTGDTSIFVKLGIGG